LKENNLKKMKNIITRIGIITLVLSMAFWGHLKGQESKDYSRLSVVLSGGATIGNYGEGFKFFRSSLNIENKTTPSFGAGLQYAITPLWSVEGGYKYMRAEAVNNSFETDINSITIKNIVNLNQLLKLRDVSSFINPYLTAGAGIDFFSFESDAESFDETEANFNVGAGIAFNISDRFDLFTNYEYHFSANNIDNKRGGFGADVMGTATGGVRINLGKKGKKHLSWSPLPVQIAQTEFDQLVADREKLNETLPEYEELQNLLEQKEDELDQVRRESEATIAGLNQKVADLEARLSLLQSERDSLQAENERLREECDCGSEIAPGHYVQIFAANELNNAIDVRNRAISRLSNILSSPEEMVFITSRRSFYEVLIGVFQRVGDSTATLNSMKEVHNDAFLKTIPRPDHLKELYQDLEKVNLNNQE
jgi:opacity protein-like surface antigen